MLPPVRSPQSIGIWFTGSLERMAFARSPFVKTLRRDYVEITPLPDAEIVLGLIGSWFEDYTEIHPHSGPKMRSPREFIAAQTATA